MMKTFDLKCVDMRACRLAALVLGLMGLVACAPRSVVGTWEYYVGGYNLWTTAKLTLHADSTYFYDGNSGDIFYTFGSTGTWRRVAPGRLLITSDWHMGIPPSALFPILEKNDWPALDKMRPLYENNILPVWDQYEPFENYPIRVRPGVLILGSYRLRRVKE